MALWFQAMDVIQPVYTPARTAPYRRIHTKILSHRVNQVQHFDAQSLDGVRGRVDVVKRIVHGDHERLAFDAFSL